MAELTEIVAALDSALTRDDEAIVQQLRERLCVEHAGTKEAAEAAYRLGLVALLKGELERADHYLRTVTRTKHDPWTPAARLALGRLLLAQNKRQQGLFELRRVVGREVPDLLSGIAAGFLLEALCDVHPFGDARAQTAEQQRARADYERILLRLSVDADASTSAWADLSLALEFQSQPNRRPEAIAHVRGALTKNALGPELHHRAETLLAQLLAV